MNSETNLQWKSYSETYWFILDILGVDKKSGILNSDIRHGLKRLHNEHTRFYVRVLSSLKTNERIEVIASSKTSHKQPIYLLTYPYIIIPLYGCTF